MNKAFKTINFIVFTLLSFGVAYYALRYFIELSNPTNPFQEKLAQSKWIVPTHLILGGLALFLTPFQLSKKLRSYAVSWHKKIGYTYVSAVFLSGIAGLLMSFSASGGWPAKLGFFCLAAGWLITTSLALIYAIKRDIPMHQRWIYRSVAFTAAAITFRLILGVGLSVLNWPFFAVYISAAWLCWIINLLICEWLLYRQGQQNNATVTTAA